MKLFRVMPDLRDTLSPLPALWLLSKISTRPSIPVDDMINGVSAAHGAQYTRFTKMLRVFEMCAINGTWL
jgi:hypothetical protein